MCKGEATGQRKQSSQHVPGFLAYSLNGWRDGAGSPAGLDHEELCELWSRRAEMWVKRHERCGIIIDEAASSTCAPYRAGCVCTEPPSYLISLLIPGCSTAAHRMLICQR